ncbi:MAG: hypothetical protein HC913_01065 [Microscillaceae bacterium]|nr:hypothetical protein [Microscillaceae bacterium]
MPLVIDNLRQPQQIEARHLLYWEDRNGMRQADMITRPSFQSYFQPLNPAVPLLPFKVYWLRLDVQSRSSLDSDWMLTLGRLTNVEVYVEQEDGRFPVRKSGQFMPYAQKDVPTGRLNHVNVFLPAHSQRKVYIRFQNQVHFPARPNLRFESKTLWQEAMSRENLVQGFFQGLLAMMFLYNFLLFVRLGDRAYFFYLAYLLSTAVYMLNYYGYWGEFVWGERPDLNYLYMPFTGYLSFIFYLQLMRDFLHTRARYPFWDVWVRFLMALFVMVMCLMLVLVTVHYQTYMVYEKYVNSGIIGVFFIVSLFILFQGDLAARYFALGSACMVAGLLVLLLGSSGVFNLPHNVWWYQAGIVAEVALFSLGLSERYKLTEKQAQEARKALILQLHENQRLQEENQQQLEQKVKQRTTEIEKQKEELLMQSEEIAAQRDLLEAQKYELEDKNKHITDSIVYASRIQSAILDDYLHLETRFSDAFVFYQPKDIVSGDFFWFAEVEAPPSPEQRRQQLAGSARFESQPFPSETLVPTVQKNTLKIVIAADCTGHGVPGAFMTVMGNALLNEIVYEKRIYEPGKILNELDRQVIRTLRQQGAKRQLYDGMDMGVLVYEEAAQKCILPELPIRFILCANTSFIPSKLPNILSATLLITKTKTLSNRTWTFCREMCFIWPRMDFKTSLEGKRVKNI